MSAKGRSAQGVATILSALCARAALIRTDSEKVIGTFVVHYLPPASADVATVIDPWSSATCKMLGGSEPSSSDTWLWPSSSCYKKAVPTPTVETLLGSWVVSVRQRAYQTGRC